MEIKIAELMAVAMVMFAEPALAQGMGAGNGGGAHVCPLKNTIEVYDIYEGRSRYGLNIISTGNVETEENIIRKAIKKLELQNVTFAHAVSDQIEYLKSLNPKHFLVSDQFDIKPIADANILITDVGCEYRQLANWDDYSNNVLVKGNYYNEMDEFNHAALKLHEAIYKASRVRLSEKNSDKVRRLVGELLSDLPPSVETVKSLTKNTDVLYSKRAPEMILNGYNSSLFLGKIKKEDLTSTLGTATVKIREWNEIDELKMRLHNGEILSKREIKEINKKINSLSALHPNTANYLILNGVELKYNASSIMAVTIDSLFFGYHFASSPQKITLDFSFQKNDGTIITASQVIDLSKDFPGRTTPAPYEFTIYGNVQ